MNHMKTKIGRRAFIKNTSVAGSGLILGFSWLNSCKPKDAEIKLFKEMPKEWFEINAYLKIGENGLVTIVSPNPEGGQNIKTSMPMIVAEELDIEWTDVIVQQAPLNTDLYSRQFIGGSQAIRRGWNGLRMTGASARQMLKEAAAQAWNVPVEEITTNSGMLYHESGNKKATYGELAASAAQLAVPEKVNLKSINDFKIIGTSRKNVDGHKIVTGKPLFGSDIQLEGMLIAMIVHPPAFGMKLKSYEESSIRSMPGIHDVFAIKVLEDDYIRQHFDTCAFLEVVAIVGNSTWEVMNAKKSLDVVWEPFDSYSEERVPYGRSQRTLNIPAGLESSSGHRRMMIEQASKKADIIRKDGDPEVAFKKAAKVIERDYTGPFLAHNCMEPMNFFADVKEDSAKLSGPLQKAELTEAAISKRLGIPVEKIDIEITRLGGGYGRRSYAHWALEAAVISQKVKAPVKLIYTREDDMTGGIYRPMYRVKYKAALDANNRLTAIHINAGGIPESPLYANRFPAGAVENYLAESWTINTNITIGSFRAPRSNFMASAEQSFLDEIAEEMDKDPIEFRLELLERARKNPVGENNDYDAERYAGVLELVKEKSNWGNEDSALKRGVSAYFCHNSYAAQVVDMKLENKIPRIEKVICAIDCGIVVNPDAASNLCEGGIVDGIGIALYGELTFKEGVPDKSNFDRYRMIRMSEAPKEIRVHFVKNDIDPTGLGEPTFPPVFGAVANALYRVTGNRHYHQPFINNPLNYS
ncbi:xanthine dehydrogenase family protein molybdopterin-binding subunit [Lutimonas zeaxanthinifaciens]|uniref:xanthine dehydrogenase family protein molybdopterin-binding subunit n=1 Tax=Lutimonas zeaxanthinifaciens TaxID=3060215 RepID=UPI00265CDA89|nr:molybdopterin cofactor-binding domain-containing protein [Lutimonas sp. YSD2104]WKK65692.1 molybdopterin-dependent oxidoreductase [Lutimonas sp. YSD2104]